MNITRQIDLVESRRSMNVPPKRQIVTRRNDFYRDDEKRLEDARELQQAINEAKRERLEKAVR